MIETSAVVLLTTHLFVTAAMVGLIWFVQVVHYPLFAGVTDLVAYENANTRLTTFVVGPFMTAEGALALWLAIAPPEGVDRALALAALGVLGIVQLSTVFLQVPAHSVLSERADAAAVDRLVRTNWVRTIGWSVRGVLAATMLVEAVTVEAAAR